MAEKPEYFDYDPVTRPRRRGGLDEEEVERGFSQRASYPEFDLPVPDKETDSQNTNSSGNRLAKQGARSLVSHQVSASRGRELSTILKRGHALSLAGVFLFTVILYFRPYELTPALSWLSSSAFWIAVVTIAVFLPTQLGLEGNLTTRTREVNLVLLLTLAVSLSIPLALSPGAALTGFGEYLKVVLIFVVMVNVVRTSTRLKPLLLLALTASCYLSLAALNDYRLGNLALEGKRISGSIGGMFGNPNDLALHLVTMTPLAVALSLAARSLLKKFLYAICAALFVMAIVVTFSRGGVLGLVVTAFVMAMKFTRRLRVLMVVVILALVLVGLAFSPGEFRERLFTTSDQSAVRRTDDLKRSIYLAIRHPLFGVGMNNFVLYSNQSKATHNAYTQVAAETGLAGAAFYVLFLVAPLKPLRRIERDNLDERKKPQAYYLAIGLQASLVGYMVSSFFASVAFLWYAYYLVAYAIALRRIYESSRVCPAALSADEPLGRTP
jgi:probable O-glycosylation ligase (exosortase A-associated)